jgi:hypothetical protein
MPSREGNELVSLRQIFRDEYPYHAWPGLNAHDPKLVQKTFEDS